MTVLGSKDRMFSGREFSVALLWVTAILGFALAALIWFRGTLTWIDVMGWTISALLVSYMIHLWIRIEPAATGIDRNLGTREGIGDE